MKKSTKKSVVMREVNFHLAIIAIAMVAAVAAGVIHYNAQQYSVALSTLDSAVLGAMSE